MTKTPKRPRDPNQLAKLMVDFATGEVDENADKKSPLLNPRKKGRGVGARP